MTLTRAYPDYTVLHGHMSCYSKSVSIDFNFNLALGLTEKLPMPPTSQGKGRQATFPPNLAAGIHVAGGERHLLP